MCFLREFGGVTPELGDFVDTSGRVSVVTADWSPTPPVSEGSRRERRPPAQSFPSDAKHNTVLLGDDAELFSPPCSPFARELDHYAARRAAARPPNALFPARKRRDRHAAGRRRGPRGLRRAAARHHRGQAVVFTAATPSPAARPSTRLYKTKNAPPAFLP